MKRYEISHGTEIVHKMLTNFSMYKHSVIPTKSKGNWLIHYKTRLTPSAAILHSRVHHKQPHLKSIFDHHKRQMGDSQ
jgi:hypothetical protein